MKKWFMQLKNQSRQSSLTQLMGAATHLFFKRCVMRASLPIKLRQCHLDAEEELSIIGGALLQGDYASWAYFQSIDTARNKQFVEKFKANMAVSTW